MIRPKFRTPKAIRRQRNAVKIHSDSSILACHDLNPINQLKNDQKNEIKSINGPNNYTYNQKSTNIGNENISDTTYSVDISQINQSNPRIGERPRLSLKEIAENIETITNSIRSTPKSTKDIINKSFDYVSPKIHTQPQTNVEKEMCLKLCDFIGLIENVIRLNISDKCARLVRKRSSIFFINLGEEANFSKDREVFLD